MHVRPGSRVFLHQAFRCCPFAGAVSSQVHDYLLANGFELVPDAEQAEVHVINTCGSDAAQAQITWNTVDEVKRRTPGAQVVALGCLVSIEPRRLREALEGVPGSARLDPRHTAELDGIFGGPVAFADVQPALSNEYVGNDFSKNWLHILASTGCLGTCSFCAIRRATGRPRSRAAAEIVADMVRGRAAGRLDQLLVSTDLGASVVDVVAAATAAAGGELRLAGESFEPTLFLEHFEALLPLLAGGRWAYVGLPIQSGSARVLRSMSRSYDPTDVLTAVARLKAAAPDLVVRTDFIFGFGDESEEEFEASISASRAFDLPSFNAYQPRPGTAPLILPTEVLRSRRDRALAELKLRADAGWATLRRAGGAEQPAHRAEAAHGRSGANAGNAEGQEPWDLPAGRTWLVDEARRFMRLLQNRPSVLLGGGWSLEAVRVEHDAVELTLCHVSGATACLGLRHPGWPGGAMARGSRYFLWVRGDPPPAELDGPLKVAIRALV
jgi:tRNA A37 methylthiotransferase MiaB